MELYDIENVNLPGLAVLKDIVNIIYLKVKIQWKWWNVARCKSSARKDHE